MHLMPSSPEESILVLAWHPGGQPSRSGVLLAVLQPAIKDSLHA